MSLPTDRLARLRAQQEKENEEDVARVEPSVPCAAPVGSTASSNEPSPSLSPYTVLDLASRLESTFDPGGNLPEDCEEWAAQHQDVIQELRGLAECALMDDDEDVSAAPTPADGAPAPVPAAEQEPKCADCGSSLNDGEAKCFTVCDRCWEVAYKKYAVAAALPHAPSPQEEYEGSGSGSPANASGTSDRQVDPWNTDRVAGAISQQPDQPNGSENASGEDSSKVAAHAPSPPTGWQPEKDEK